MENLRKRWQIAPRIPPSEELLLEKIPPVLRQILYNRGYRSVEDASAFIHARPPGDCSPLGILGMEAAVDRICYAVEHRQSIAVYGDYDADGVTATALLTQALQALGAEVIGYIPNRFDEGYGLNNEALDNLRSQGVELVITVDCGIRSIAEAEHARQIGLDLIISDHHTPSPELPTALAVINPKQPGCTYAEKNLAGVGLAYKIVEGLFARLAPGSTTPFLSAEDYLDLVALGTVADLASLTGENRSLVKRGIEKMRRPIRQGLLSLIGVSGLAARNVTATDIGFALGPRLNAAGRLDSALASLQLLMTQDVQEAGHLAQQLEVQNRERQNITRTIQEQAETTILNADPGALLLFAVHSDYNPGVVGLAASRLTERYYRPSIVAYWGEETTRASCRSIPEFHITHALDECADLLIRHGGHAAAAGFTVRNENLPELMRRLKCIAERELSNQDLRPTVKADLELPLSELRPELLRYIDWLQPTGQDNPQPCFVSRDLKVKNYRSVGKEGGHLKMTVTDGSIAFDAIAFRQGHWLENMPDRVDLLYCFEKNEYNGRESLQLNVKDMKPAGVGDD